MTTKQDIIIKSDIEGQLKKSTSQIMIQANTMIVGDDETYTEAVEFLARLKKHMKEVAKDKESIYRPAKNITDEISARYKPILSEGEAAEKIVKAKVLDFVREKERIELARIKKEAQEREEIALKAAQDFMDEYGSHAKEAASKARERAAKLREEGNDELADRFERIAIEQEAKLTQEADKRADEALKEETERKKEKVVLTTKSETGKSVVSKFWTFEEIDISKVPPEFLVLDAVKVRAAIGAGNREINGLRIFQDERVSIRGF